MKISNPAPQLGSGRGDKGGGGTDGVPYYPAHESVLPEACSILKISPCGMACGSTRLPRRCSEDAIVSSPVFDIVRYRSERHPRSQHRCT
jgi:hypothetical protein